VGQPWTTEQKINAQVDRIERNLTTLHCYLRELRDDQGEDVDRDFDYIENIRCILERIVERHVK
jgi:hypothetical protein